MLRVQDLAAGYQTGARVLDGVSLAVAAGEVVALIGRNGMGKTSLLKALTGHLPVAAGEVSLDGRPLTNAAPHRIARAGIGYVPQGREIFGDLTVEQNLLLGTLGKPGLAKAVPGWVYKLFPVLRELGGQRGGTLSGGQQQLLAIARALVGSPKLLLLDEPSEGIQPSVVQQIGRALGEVAGARGLSILLVEQNLELVKTLAQRCLFMENGRIAEAVTDMGRLDGDSPLVHRYLAV